MIYFLKCAGADAAKIGFAANKLGTRLQQIQCGNPFELELLHVIEGDRKLEARIHLAIGTAHGGCRGEWFRLSAVLDFLSLIEEHGVLGALSLMDDAAEASSLEIAAASAVMVASLHSRGVFGLVELTNLVRADPAFRAELLEFSGPKRDDNASLAGLPRTRPTAAPASFPYAHRTLAEVSDHSSEKRALITKRVRLAA